MLHCTMQNLFDVLYVDFIVVVFFAVEASVLSLMVQMYHFYKYYR